MGFIRAFPCFFPTVSFQKERREVLPYPLPSWTRLFGSMLKSEAENGMEAEF
jgi:hypothetical protein